MYTKDVISNNPELDNFILEDIESYNMYFQYVERIFNQVLEAYYENGEQVSGHTSHEKEIVAKFLQRMKNTIVALSVGSHIDPDHQMKIDVTESGLPNYKEIFNLEVSMRGRDCALSNVPPSNDLVQSMLDFVFTYKKEPKELLLQSLTRFYYEKLIADDLFLSFNFGETIPLGKNKGSGREQYLISWGFYDTNTNVPYVNILLFEDSREQSAMLTQGVVELKEKLRIEDSAYLPLSSVAELIDQKTEIFPKMIKRIALGPIFGKYSLDDSKMNLLLKNMKPMDPVEDFIFSLTTEIVVSPKEESRKGLLSSKSVRQNFFVMREDYESLVRGVSSVVKNIFAPTKVAQHIYDDETFQLSTEYHVVPITQNSSSINQQTKQNK